MNARILIPCLAFVIAAFASASPAKDLRGTIKIQQPDGLVVASGDGSIVMRVREPGKETYSIESEVLAGQYTMTVPDDCTIQVLATRTTEGAGYPLDRGRFLDVPKSGEYNVVVRIPLKFLLRVYGADGRTELSDITVIRKLRKHARLELPGPLDSKTRLLYQDVDSPIVFPISEPEYYTYYVHAPGHAWTQISPDPFLGGVQTMQLPEGGVLNVTLVQEGPNRGRVFRIRNLNPKPDAHPLVHELKRYDNQIEVKGLPVGKYHISSEDPIRSSNMPVYGEMDIEIRPGETLDLKLPLSAEPLFSPVPAAGTVQIPKEWGTTDGLTFQLQRLDPYGQWGRNFEIRGTDLTPVEGHDSLYSWNIPEVAPGAYNLSFQHTSYSVYREIYGNGHLRLDYVLPPPRTVQIQTIDDRTGEPIFPDTLTWSALEPEAIRKKIKDTAPFLSERRRLTRVGEADAYSLYAVNSALRIRLDDPKFDPAELIIKEEGNCRVEWKLHRATGLRIFLAHGEESVKWTGDARILSEDSNGKVVSARDLGRSTQFQLSAPGRYTIRFPKLRGFSEIPPQTVRVQDGEVLELKVSLTPN